MQVFGQHVSILMSSVFCLAGCGDDSEGGRMACLEPLDLECAPAFQPSFDQLYDRQLGATCGAAGPNCHGAEGLQGMGLDLSERDHAYEMLLGRVDGRPRVIEGDPECSLLIQRLESEDPTFVMPQGVQLTLPVRCAFRLWVANGAQRSEP